MTAVFGDRLFTATDLNRDSRRVLDAACQGPVTITRHDQHFALMQRDRAAALVRMQEAASRAVEALIHARRILRQDPADPPASLHWLRHADHDDIQNFIDELLDTFTSVAGGYADPSRIDDVLYEWEESARMAMSPEVAKAYAAPAEPEPLWDPRLPMPGPVKENESA